MKAITLAYDSEGKASLLHGPEVSPQEQKATRLAARNGELPDGIVRLESFVIGPGNRLGVAVSQVAVAEKAPQPAKPLKPPKPAKPLKPPKPAKAK